jgi:hypothetical protein
MAAPLPTKVVLGATRDITVDEEICISYVDIADETEAE